MGASKAKKKFLYLVFPAPFYQFHVLLGENFSDVGGWVGWGWPWPQTTLLPGSLSNNLVWLMAKHAFRLAAPRGHNQALDLTFGPKELATDHPPPPPRKFEDREQHIGQMEQLLASRIHKGLKRQ